VGALPRIEIDGRSATAEELWAVAGFGHFTAMQVRGRATRGLDLHLARLDASSRELTGNPLDGDRVQDLIRHALRDDFDASVRVYIFHDDVETSVLVTVLPPGDAPTSLQRLMSVDHVRPIAHVKHAGGFAQAYYRRAAQSKGYDDALFTTADDLISETTVANIGFFQGPDIVWPDAPLLRGITMQLLDRHLALRGTPSRHEPIRLADASTYDGAFVANSRGLAAVSGIDGETLPLANIQMGTLADVYESIPWDPIPG
jgi:branched-subunit amino acid aminotransferase/4-amino-4-deoxychorismate lyase